MRQKVMAFNARAKAWMMERLKGVWLDPIFLGIFVVMAVVSLISALRLQRKALYYSTLTWALAALMCLRRIQGIRKREKEEQKNQNMEGK